MRGCDCGKKVKNGVKKLFTPNKKGKMVLPLRIFLFLIMLISIPIIIVVIVWMMFKLLILNENPGKPIVDKILNRTETTLEKRKLKREIEEIEE